MGSFISLPLASLSACCCVAQSCCTLAVCCGCKQSRTASKALYVLLFTLSTIFAVVLRYWGQAILGGWTDTLGVCTDGNVSMCYGQQAAYRVSGAVTGFFTTMLALCVFYPPAHLAAWFVKTIFYLALLFVSLAIPNGAFFWCGGRPALHERVWPHAHHPPHPTPIAAFFTGYAEFARYGSIFFLLAQVIIVIDEAYSIHEGLLSRISATEAAFEAAGWEPGLCSNPWKVLYVLLAVGSVGAGVAGVVVMFAFLGNCPLNQLFLGITLALGLVYCVISMCNSVGKGLLPPAMLFAYNTWLAYGAISNNPDQLCNAMARPGATNTAAIVSGVVISAISVSYAAYSSGSAAAGGVGGGEEAATTPVGVSSANPVTGVGAEPSGAPKDPKDGSASPASYGAAAPVSPTGGSGRSRAGSDDEEDLPPTPADRKPWAFHLLFALGGLYIAMLATNYGDPSTYGTTDPTLSTVSMWVRIATQWTVQVLYAWTLVAPLCCPGRDWS